VISATRSPEIFRQFFLFKYGREKLKILSRLWPVQTRSSDRISLMSGKAKAKAAPKSGGGASASATAVKKAVRTPKNIFQVNSTEEEYIPVSIKARRIQKILHGPKKGQTADHYLVQWQGYEDPADETWEPIDNLYGHEDLVQEYEAWLKEENARVLENIKATKRAKIAAAAEAEKEGSDGSDESGGSECDDVVDVSESGKKRKKTRKLKSRVWTSNSCKETRDEDGNISFATCLIMVVKTDEEQATKCGVKFECKNSSPAAAWAHLRKYHPDQYAELKYLKVGLSALFC